MSSTAKTVLIVGGAAVGVFVLLRLLTPSVPTVAGSKAQTNTGALNINGLIGLGTSLASVVGGIFKSTPNDGTYHADTSGFSISGNTLVDASGNALDYGAGF